MLLITAVIVADYLINTSLSNQTSQIKLLQYGKNAQISILELRRFEEELAANKNNNTLAAYKAEQTKLTSFLEAMAMLAGTAELKKTIVEMLAVVPEKAKLQGRKITFGETYPNLQSRIDKVFLSAEHTLKNESLWLTRVQFSARLVLLILAMFALYTVMNLINGIRSTINKPLEKLAETIKTVAAGNTTIQIPANEQQGIFVEISQAVETFKDNSISHIRLEKKFSAKSADLVKLHNELARPINAILSLCDILLAKGLTPEQQRYVRLARANASTLMRAGNNVFDYSTLDKELFVQESADADLFEFLDIVVSDFVEQAENKKVELRLSRNENLPRYVSMDTGRLRQILSNLIGNAVKYTNEGSVLVSVSHRMLSKSLVEFQCSIKDTGMGVEPNKRAKLFNWKHPNETSSQRLIDNGGLSLPVTRQLVELLGGSIAFDSEIAQGSTFRFTINCQLAQPRSVQNTGSPASIEKMRILVAEDNRVNQLLISQILRKAGHYVDVVNNGFETVEAMLVAPYDVILMDIQMPGMDGPTAAQKIRKIPGKAGQIPIIALTAHAGSTVRQAYLAAGMDDHIVKPVEPDLLFKTISTAIEMRRKPEIVQVLEPAIKVEDPAQSLQLEQPSKPEQPPKPEQTSRPEIPRIKLGRPAERKTPKIVVNPVAGKSDTEPVSAVTPEKKGQVRQEIVPLFDEIELNNLRKSIGPETMKQLLKTVPDELVKLLRDIKLALERGDYETMWAMAHSLKGVARNYSASRVAALAHEVEVEARKYAINSDKIDNLEEAIEHTQNWLEETA